MRAEACAKGDYETLCDELRILSRSPEKLADELSYGDDWAGSTPLHWASYSGAASCVNVLLEYGADARATNSRDASLPIHLAARYGHSSVLAALVDWDPDLMLMQNNRGNTALHEAAVENQLDSVRFFIERARRLEGASPCTAGAVGTTGSGGAASVGAAGSGVSLAALLQSTTVREQGGHTPLLAAVEYGQLKSVRLLIDARSDLSTAPLNRDRMLEVTAVKVARCRSLSKPTHC